MEGLKEFVGVKIWAEAMAISGIKDEKKKEEAVLLSRMKAESVMQERAINADNKPEWERYELWGYCLKLKKKCKYLLLKYHGRTIMWRVDKKIGAIQYSMVKLQYKEKPFKIDGKDYLLRYLVPTEKVLSNIDPEVEDFNNMLGEHWERVNEKTN